MYCQTGWNFSGKMKYLFWDCSAAFCLLILLLLFFITVIPKSLIIFFYSLMFLFLFSASFFFTVYTQVNLCILLLVLRCFCCAVCCTTIAMSRYLKKKTSPGVRKWKNWVHFKQNRTETVKPTLGHSFRQAPEWSCKHQCQMKSWGVGEN